MKELIKIEMKGSSQVVSARELHKFLESAERFSKWFDRMKEYGFVLNEDYTPYFLVHPQNKQENEDYVLTLDCAKQIAMLQRNDKGKEARQYFIACEKALATAQTKVYATEIMPHVKRGLEIGKELEKLELAKVGLKKELEVLHKLPHGCKFCGKVNKNYHANTQHESYCSQNPEALKSNLPSLKAQTTEKRGELC